MADYCDLGAWRSAEELAARLGVPVAPATVEELARAGLVPVTGSYKGHDLYSAEALAAVTAGQVAAADAGRPLNMRQAARHLGVRHADFRRLVRAGLIIPDQLAPGRWADVRLFLPASLDEFAARPGIDWEEVRATPAGRRTPLWDLAEPDLILQALGGPKPPKVKPQGRT